MSSKYEFSARVFFSEVRLIDMTKKNAEKLFMQACERYRKDEPVGIKQLAEPAVATEKKKRATTAKVPKAASSKSKESEKEDGEVVAKKKIAILNSKASKKQTSKPKSSKSKTAK